MIKYNELRIDGDNLIVDFEIEDKPYYADQAVIITGVRIDSQLTYGTEYPFYIESENNCARFVRTIPIPNIKKDLIIITPQVHFEELEGAPCGATIVNVSAIYDESVLLEKGMVFLKELSNTCNIPKGFIDFILKKHALDLSIKTCNYEEAIKYWDMLNKKAMKFISNNCGCHGFN